MNLADTATLLTVVGCPLAAGISAASEKAGWLTLLFVALGAGLGYGGGYCVRAVSYWLLFTGCKQPKPWLSAAGIIAYMLIPMFLTIAFTGLSAGLTGWLVQVF